MNGASSEEELDPDFCPNPSHGDAEAEFPDKAADIDGVADGNGTDGGVAVGKDKSPGILTG